MSLIKYNNDKFETIQAKISCKRMLLTYQNKTKILFYTPSHEGQERKIICVDVQFRVQHQVIPYPPKLVQGEGVSRRV